MRLPPFNPRLAIGIGIIAISFTSIFVKLLSTMPASIIASYRLIFPLIILWPIILLYKRRELKNIKSKEWIRLIITGILLAFHLGFWFYALQLTSVTSAVLILALQPVFLLIASMIFSRDQYSAGAWISIVITFVGGFLIISGDYELLDSSFYGDVILLVSLTIITIYQVVVQRVKRNLSYITYITLIYSIGVFVLAIYNVIQANSYIGYETLDWTYLVLLGLVPTFLGYSLINWALRWVRAQTVSSGLVLEPLIATALAYYILKETIAPFHWLGGSVIIFGLLLFMMSTRRKRDVTISKKVTQEKRE